MFPKMRSIVSEFLAQAEARLLQATDQAWVKAGPTTSAEAPARATSKWSFARIKAKQVSAGSCYLVT